jgi:hypothetical protein
METLIGLLEKSNRVGLLLQYSPAFKLARGHSAAQHFVELAQSPSATLDRTPRSPHALACMLGSYRVLPRPLR